MGILGFYKNLILTYPNITEALNNVLEDEQDIFLYLDFNAMIHPCMASVVSRYINVEEINRKIIELEIFEDIKNEINNIVDKINPNFLMISTDGVAPRAKMEQQRYRRYNSLRNPTRKIFDTNSISPGTPFMKHLSLFLNKFIKEELNKKCKVLYSDHAQAGEGEHKIINFIRNLKEENENIVHIINSLDSDLIMLSMMLNKNNIYLLREKQHYENKKDVDIDNMDLKYHFLNISYVKDYIWDEFNSENDFKKNISKEQYIIDFIFLCFFIGNDFLPHFKIINTYNGGVELMIKKYKEVMKNNPSRLIDDNNEINQNMLIQLLKELNDNENKYIYKNNKIKRDTIVRYYEKGWKGRYYNYYLGNSTFRSVDEMSFNFCQMLKWTTKYYLEGNKNWSWYYRYGSAPCMSDLYDFLHRCNINEITIPIDKSYTMNQQLMIILPPQSSHLVPRKYSNLMFKKLRYMYTRHYKLDKVDKKFAFMYRPILPYMNDDTIKKFIKD
jgi:5'-3' exonuclease